MPASYSPLGFCDIAWWRAEQLEIIHLNYWVMSTSHFWNLQGYRKKHPIDPTPKEKHQRKNTVLWTFESLGELFFITPGNKNQILLEVGNLILPVPHSSLGWVYAASAPKRSLAVNFYEKTGAHSPQQWTKTSDFSVFVRYQKRSMDFSGCNIVFF